MFKKTAAILVVAGALLFSGVAAANASTYPVEGGGLVTSDTTPAPGQEITLTATIPSTSPQDFAVFTLSGGDGATLASIVRTAAPAGLQKPVVDGTSAAVFKSNSEGTFTVAAYDSNGLQVGSVTLVVSAANAGGSTSDPGALPATGGTVPLTAIWLGVGALGIGSIAVVAGVARRRAQSNH
ncbi:hypothetical protein [uncultured Microbacterium sp.]|uniref:hypothetical protein n=1 Tax=uncultured Microbacterium sp. TaxID=191216 RepID=UPI0035C95A32